MISIAEKHAERSRRRDRKKYSKASRYTASRSADLGDTRPQGVRTLEIHGF